MGRHLKTPPGGREQWSAAGVWLLSIMLAGGIFASVFVAYGAYLWLELHYGVR